MKIDERMKKIRICYKKPSGNKNACCCKDRWKSVPYIYQGPDFTLRRTSGSGNGRNDAVSL